MIGANNERRSVLRERASRRALDFMAKRGLVGYVTWSADQLGDHFLDLLCAIEAEAEAREFARCEEILETRRRDRCNEYSGEAARCLAAIRARGAGK